MRPRMFGSNLRPLLYWSERDRLLESKLCTQYSSGKRYPRAPIDSKGKQRVTLSIYLESTTRLPPLGQSSPLIAPQSEKALTVELLAGARSVNQVLRNLDDQSSNKARQATTCVDTANRKRTLVVCDRSIGFLNARLDRGIGRHDSFCGTPPPATAPNLIPQRLDYLTSDRVPDHIKPRSSVYAYKLLKKESPDDAQ